MTLRRWGNCPPAKQSLSITEVGALPSTQTDWFHPMIRARPSAMDLRRPGPLRKRRLLCNLRLLEICAARASLVAVNRVAIGEPRLHIAWKVAIYAQNVP